MVFARLEASGGILLLGATVLALLWANSVWAPSYKRLLTASLGPLTAGHWVNDGLMALFFLVVGLEIKREFLAGELRSPKLAFLPIAAAIGGMLIPAGIYAAFNRGGPGAAGWGIPMATDIAFSLAILALLRDRVPIGLRLLLTSIAIVDDLGAVVVIAFAYTQSIQWLPLGVAGLALVVLAALNRFGVRSLVPYLGLGLVVWVGFLSSGVHATIAGVMVALTFPLDSRGGEAESPLHRLERTFHPWVAFGVLPLFAFFNAGVEIVPSSGSSLAAPMGLGILVGLVLGKPLGIVIASLVAVKARVARLPDGVTWHQVIGLGLIAGIGFTMSIFIADLAFSSEAQRDAAKVAILLASSTAGVIGSFWLRAGGGKPSSTPGDRPGTSPAEFRPD